MSTQQLLQDRQRLIRVKHELDKTIDASLLWLDSQAFAQSWKFRRASGDLAGLVRETLAHDNTVYVKVGEQALTGYHLYKTKTMTEPIRRTSIAEPGAMIPLKSVELPPYSFEDTYLGCKHIMLGCQAIIASHSTLHVGESAQVQHDFITQYKKIRPQPTVYKS